MLNKTLYNQPHMNLKQTLINKPKKTSEKRVHQATEIKLSHHHQQQHKKISDKNKNIYLNINRNKTATE